MSLPPLPSCSNRGVGSTEFELGFARKEQWGSELTRGQWEKPHRSTSLPGYVNPLWRGLWGVLISLYSAVTILLAWIFLREHLQWSQWLGVGIIFGGFVLVNL